MRRACVCDVWGERGPWRDVQWHTGTGKGADGMISCADRYIHAHIRKCSTNTHTRLSLRLARAFVCLLCVSVEDWRTGEARAHHVPSAANGISVRAIDSTFGGSWCRAAGGNRFPSEKKGNTTPQFLAVVLAVAVHKIIFDLVSFILTFSFLLSIAKYFSFSSSFFSFSF